MKSHNLATPPQEGALTLKYVAPADGIVRTHSDNLDFAQRADGVCVTFGQIIDVPADNVVVIEQACSISMSWLQAKLVAELLSAKVAAYESKNGVLKSPELPMPQKQTATIKEGSALPN